MRIPMLIAALAALAISASAADEAFSHSALSVNDRFGLNDQVIGHDAGAVSDLNGSGRFGVQLVGGYRSLEAADDTADEISLGAGVRYDLTPNTIVRAGVGIRLRDGSETIATEQEVTTVTTSDKTTTTTIITPGKVHTPHGNGHHYGWCKQKPKPPTVTTVTTSTHTVTTSVEMIDGTDTERLNSSLFGYASIGQRFRLIGPIGLELAADGILLRDGYEANLSGMLTCGPAAIGVVDQVREYYDGAGHLLALVESEDRGLGLAAQLRFRGATVGATYLIDQQTVMGQVGFAF